MVRPELMLMADKGPALGSHVVTPRRGCLHHGNHVGGGTVVHYAVLANGLRLLASGRGFINGWIGAGNAATKTWKLLFIQGTAPVRGPIGNGRKSNL